MSAADFLRLKKLTGSGRIKAAARHNRRAIQAERGASGSIDPTRTYLNETLAGPATADAVAELASELMKAAGIGKLRKDAVRGIELLFSLHADHRIDDRAYFADCLLWTETQYGGAANILSADIHRDEAQPHLHVLVLPLLNGRMVGSDMVGGRSKLLATRLDFYRTVAARHGLAKAPGRLLGASKAAGVASVLDRLKTGADSVLRSALWPQFKDAIERDPAPYMAAFAIEAQRKTRRPRTSTEIFISPGRGPKREPKPIGFAVRSMARTLSCVGVAPPSSTATAAAAPAVAQPDRAVVPLGGESGPASRLAQSPDTGEFIRERDDERDTALYDSETGEFQPQRSKGARARVGERWWSDALTKADLDS